MSKSYVSKSNSLGVDPRGVPVPGGREGDGSYQWSPIPGAHLSSEIDSQLPRTMTHCKEHQYPVGLKDMSNRGEEGT